MMHPFEKKFIIETATESIHRREDCFLLAEQIERSLETISTQPELAEQCNNFTKQISTILSSISIEKLAKMNNDTETHAAIELAYSKLTDLQEQINSTFKVDEKEELEDK